VAWSAEAGRFRIYWRYNGWRAGPLGSIYRPKYFHAGYALHGMTSVPAYPASHGCVRMTSRRWTACGCPQVAWHRRAAPSSDRMLHPTLARVSRHRPRAEVPGIGVFRPGRHLPRGRLRDRRGPIRLSGSCQGEPGDGVDVVIRGIAHDGDPHGLGRVGDCPGPRHCRVALGHAQPWRQRGRAVLGRDRARCRLRRRGQRHPGGRHGAGREDHPDRQRASCLLARW
jgi:L,D-transpeptidase catalytic domain